jgi:hypothetical protein
MSRPRRSTQIRAQREAKEIARYFGFGSPLPESDEPEEELPEPDTRRQELQEQDFCSSGLTA